MIYFAYLSFDCIRYHGILYEIDRSGIDSDGKRYYVVHSYTADWRIEEQLPRTTIDADVLEKDGEYHTWDTGSDDR